MAVCKVVDAAGACAAGSDHCFCNDTCVTRKGNIEGGWYLDEVHTTSCSGNVIAIEFQVYRSLRSSLSYGFTVSFWKPILKNVFIFEMVKCLLN